MNRFENRNHINIDLFKAIFENDIKIVERIVNGTIFDPFTVELIKNGERFDCTENELRDTPLHYAARRNKIEIIGILLKSCGKMIESKNKDSEFPAHVALKMKHVESFKLLCPGFVATARNKHSKNLLHLAVIQDVAEVITFLCEKVDVNTKTEKGFSPILLAAMSGNERIVKILIKENADLTAINLYGDTPLHAAVRYDQLNVCKLLIQHGCELDALNGRKDSVLQIAICRKNIKIAKLLLKSGARKDIRDIEGNTAFDTAVKAFENSKDADSFMFVQLLKDNKIEKFFNYIQTKFTGKPTTAYQSVAYKRCKTQLDQKFSNPLNTSSPQGRLREQFIVNAGDVISTQISKGKLDDKEKNSTQNSF